MLVIKCTFIWNAARKLQQSIKSSFMNELINRIVQKTGVPADKAQQVLGVVAGFIKQKFPQFGGQIDSFLGVNGGQAADAKSDNPLGDLGSKLGL